MDDERVEKLMILGMPPKSFPDFPRLALELRNLIWESTFSQPRVFDDGTLRLLNPRNGVMYSYLTPYALYVCRDSRDFAQSRLCRTFLFREGLEVRKERYTSTRNAMPVSTGSLTCLGDQALFLAIVLLATLRY